MIQDAEEPLTKDEINDIQEGLEDVKAGRVKSIEEVAKNYGIKLKA
jgi:predicted transcriptional regulator